MQESMLNHELANLDLSKIAALQQKRTLAFVNHFVINTVQFLNNFMKKCEQKLMRFERKLEKVEAAMVILETRLSSIPEVNMIQTDTKQEVNTIHTETKQEVTSEMSTGKMDQDISETTINKEQESTQETSTQDSTAQIQPEYDRFVKMVQVGVPLEAVKLKVSLEGLDPSVLVKILGK